MAIDYTGHCAFDNAEAQHRVDYLRRTRPDWYIGMHHLTDAKDLGPFGAEIARGFGIEARCNFSLHLLNKDWLEQSSEAVEFLYEVFGTEKLVVTFGMDSVRAPRRQYPAMAL